MLSNPHRAPIVPRDYQVKMNEEIREAYKIGHRRVVGYAPTGSGKSTMLNCMLEQTKKRTLILAHRTELIHQISQSLTVRHGIIMPGHSSTDDAIQVGMVPTVARRLDRLPPFDWVISDEVHLAISPTWLSILKHYENAWHLGLSASPVRLDGRGLNEHYEYMVYGPSIDTLTERGFLVPCRVFAPQTNVGAIRTSGHDFNMSEAAKEFGKSMIVGDAVSHVLKHASDRLTIVFCCSREHADQVATQFTAAGLPAVNVDGSMNSSQRKQRIADFRSGKVRVLTNVDLLTTGWDCPEVSAAVFLRPTRSTALYLQMLGRILRPFPGKRDAILLDHANNVRVHGLPDEDRQWSLDGAAAKKRKTKDEDEIAVRQCPDCFHIHKPAPVCPECGTQYPIKSRKIEQQDGELAEIDRSEANSIPLRDAMRGVRTAADLYAIARERGYQRGWVFHQARIRNIPLGSAA